jgi:hypothetical protein
VNLLGDNIDIINKNTETLIDASIEVGLEVNVEKTKYMLVSCDQNASQNRNIEIGNRSFENLFQKDIKRRLNSGNACHHLVQNPSVFSSAVKKCKG